ncbi:MAG: hypothetical protein K6A37_06590 [Saccharofermentans sp.]|nr:hypothetical protein [Saccharofermentans sp.]
MNWKKLVALALTATMVMSLLPYLSGDMVLADETSEVIEETVVPEETGDSDPEVPADEDPVEVTGEITEEEDVIAPDEDELGTDVVEEESNDEVVISEDDLIAYDDCLGYQGYTRIEARDSIRTMIDTVYIYGAFPNGYNLLKEYLGFLGYHNERVLGRTADFDNWYLPERWTRCTYNYQIGDIAVWRNNLVYGIDGSTVTTDDFYGHCGIIVDCDASAFYAVEAIYDPSSGTSRVWERRHPYSELLYTVRPRFSDSLIPGWRVENNVWRYYYSNGRRATGFSNVEGNYYYFDDNGYYTDGWKVINGYWYYFAESGRAYVSTTKTINGKTYHFDSNGICTDRAPVVEVNMYRLYNPNSGEHFYTSNVEERRNLISLGWNDEGIGWVAPQHSNTPVYRLYNQYGGEHHYTTSLAERQALISAGWSDEGIGWYSDDEETFPLYRQYNPNEFANNHNYTTSLAENDFLVSLGWQAEDIGWYGIGR